MQRKWRHQWRRAVAAVLFITAVTCHGYAMPQGGKITAGTGGISQTEHTVTIAQGSDRMSVNWQSFGLAQNERVMFQQPSASSIVLNRVVGNDLSALYGKITANGKVFLINPNGILFGPSSQLDVGGLVASTLQLSDKDFMTGNYHFLKGANGKILNQGNISASVGGYVLMLAPEVQNEGVVIARQGTIAFGTGSQITLDFNGDGLVNLKVDQGVLNSYTANSGIMNAEGGLVVMTARTADNLINTVVNNTGIIQAQSLREKNGTIVLEAGPSGVVSNSGTLDASGRNSNETGGNVKVLGEKVALLNGNTINASGNAGGGTVLIGGNFHGAGPEKNASAVYIERNTSITVDAIVQGDGGKIAIWSDGATRFYGSASAKGGRQSGNGGCVETSGRKYLDAQGTVDTGAFNGKGGQWLLDPSNITIQAGDSSTDANISGNPKFSTISDDGILSTGSLVRALNNGGSVTIITGAGSQAGDITVKDDIVVTGTGDATLTLNAYRDIVLKGKEGSNAPVFFSSGGKLNLVFNPDDGMADGIAFTGRNGLGAISLYKDIVTNGGSIQFGGGSNYTVGTYIGGNGRRTVSTSAGTVLFYGDVMLATQSGGVTLDTGSIRGGGDLLFLGNLDSNLANNGLTIRAGSGNVLFKGSIGSKKALGGLNIETAQDVTFVDTINVSGNIDIGSKDPVHDISILNTITTTNNGFTAISNTGVITIDAAGDMNLDGQFLQQGAVKVSTSGDIHTTADAIIFNSPVLLNGSLKYVSAGGDITFNDTVNSSVSGAYSLLLDAGITGKVTFADAVGMSLGNGSLDSLIVSSADTTYVRQKILAHNVYLTADSLGIDTANGGINTGSGSIVIRPMTTGRPIHLGTEDAGSLSLQPEEVKLLAAGTLRIGDTSSGIAGAGAGIASGDILISNPIAFGGVDAVHLITPASVIELASGAITATKLAVTTTGGAVSLSTPNAINMIAVAAGNALTINNGTADLSISTIDGVAGINSGSYNTTLVSNGSVSQDAAIVSAGLELLGGKGAYILTQNSNQIKTLAGDLGTLDFSDSNSFIVGQVNTTSGLSIQNSASLNASGTNADLKVSKIIKKTGSGNGSLYLKANRDVFINYDISALPGVGLWDITAAANGGSNGGVVSVALSCIDSNGGNIVIGGGSDPLHSASQGRANTDILKRGILIDASRLLSRGGDITLHGKGFSGYADNADGITVKGDSLLDSGTGKILLSGNTAAMSGYKSMGVSISGYGTKLSSANTAFDALEINGSGTNAANNTTNYASYNGGVSIQYGASILAGADGGGIYVTGIGGKGQDSWNDGIILSTEGGQPITLRTTTGPISLIGMSGVNASASGIYTTGSGNLVTSDTGSITLVSDTLSLNNITFKGGGVFSVKPLQGSTSMGIGTNAAGTLNLTADELRTITDGFHKLVFGDAGNAGAITVGAAAFTDPVEIYGGTITIGDILDTGMNALKLDSGSTVIEQAGGAIRTSSLLVTAGNMINLGKNNAIGTVAIHSAANEVTINNGSKPLKIGMVDGITGVSANGPVTLLSGMDITLEQPVRTSAAGDAIIIAAGGNFINQAGTNALQTSGDGRWLVYSSSPDLDIFGGLVSGGHALWGKEYTGSSIALPGNHYIFGYTPTLTFTSDDVHKIYGNDAAVALAGAYTVHGIMTDTYGGVILADTNTDAFAGTPSLTSVGAAVTAHVSSSPYGITISQGTLSSSAGYTFDFISTGNLTVDRRVIEVTATDRSKTYGEELTLGTIGFHVSETLPNGDGISGVTLASAGAAKTAHRSDGDKGIGQYSIFAQNAVFGHGQSEDYAITYHAGTLTVISRPIIVTADDRTKIYGDELSLGTTAFTVQDGATGLLPNGDQINNVDLYSMGVAAAANRDEGDKGIGMYGILPGSARFSRGNSNDYHIAYQEGKLEISPAVLTYVAKRQTNYNGDALLELTGSITGFVYGETVTSATNGKLTFSTFATPSSPIGKYAITGGGLTARHENYTFVQSDGNDMALTIVDATRRNEAIARIVEQIQTESTSALPEDLILQTVGKTNDSKVLIEDALLLRTDEVWSDAGLRYSETGEDNLIPDRLVITGTRGTSDSYHITDYAMTTKLTLQSESGKNMGNRAINEIPIFKVTDETAKRNGAYVVTNRGDELTLRPLNYPYESHKNVATGDKSTYVAVSLGSLGTGTYNISFNGFVLLVYPLDNGAKTLIRRTDAGRNKLIVSAVLLAGVTELGLSIKEIKEVYLYAN